MTIDAPNHRQITSDIFGDLPDALINELLTRAADVGKSAHIHVATHLQARDSLRKRAHQLGLIKELPDLSHLPTESVSAVDGSLISERLVSFDLNSAAALAVDGIGFDADENGPRHDIAVHPTKPLRYGREATYALMFCMEYDIALKEASKRDIVLLDGAFSTGVIAISKALQSTFELRDELSCAFKNRWTSSTRDNLPNVLTSRQIIALPKRSATNEFATQTRLFRNREIDTNGRSTASLILNEREYSGPFEFDTRTPQYQPPSATAQYWRDLRHRFEELHVIYFKPHSWSHAYRIETPRIISDNQQRLHSVLDIIKRQCANPAMMEPYPLYVADRFAKSLSKGADALLDAVRRDVIANSEDPEIAYTMLNAYRTEPMVEEVEE